MVRYNNNIVVFFTAGLRFKISIEDSKTLKFHIFKFSAGLGVVASHAHALPARPPAPPRARVARPCGVHGSGGV